MAKWNQLVITDAGYQLSAKTLGGTKIQYTHAQTTDKNMTAFTSDELKAVTKLDNVVQDLPVGVVTIQDDHTVDVPVKVSNQDVTADYLLCGLAIFAKPEDGDEILYGIATAASPDLMVAQNGSTVVGTNFMLKVHVGSAANVNIIISPDGSVSNEELAGTLKKYVLLSELAKQLPSDIAHTAEDNEFKGKNKFDQDPTNASGDAYVTAVDADKHADDGDAATLTAAEQKIADALAKMLADDGSLTIGGKTFMPVIDNQNGTMTVNKQVITPADEGHVVTVSEAGKGSKVDFDTGNLTVDGASVLGVTTVYTDDDADAVTSYAAAHPTTIIVHKDGTRPADELAPWGGDA